MIQNKLLITIIVTILFIVSYSYSYENKIVEVTRGYFENKEIILEVKTRFSIPDTNLELKEDISFYLEGSFLYLSLKDKQNRIEINKYIIKLDYPDTYYGDLIIEDKTILLKSDNPIFEWTSEASSDRKHYEFISLENNSLKYLFSIDELVPNSLKRKDAETISGKLKDRDEIVFGRVDYDFDFTFNDNKIKINIQNIQPIHSPTFALEDIEGFSISNNNVQKEYIIKKGTEFYIDTFDRVNQIVKIIIFKPKKLIYYIPVENLEGKIEVNTAG